MFVLIVVFYLLCFSFLFLWSMFLSGSRPKSDPKLVAQNRPIGRPQTLTWSSSHELCMAFFLHELQLAHLPAMHCSPQRQKFRCMLLRWLDLEHPRAENPAYTGPALHARQKPTTPSASQLVPAAFRPASTCTAPNLRIHSSVQSPCQLVPSHSLRPRLCKAHFPACLEPKRGLPSAPRDSLMKQLVLLIEEKK